MDKKQLENKELREAYQHQQMLVEIRNVLVTPAGRVFIKYLLKEFDVCEVPVFGLSDEFLREKLGAMRAAHALWKVLCEADPDQAAKLLAQVERERYAELMET